MKLYGDPDSPGTRKVLLAIAEKGARIELVLVDPGIGQHKQPAHLARHPYGELPVLEHDDFTLYEALAIARYLDVVLDGPSLTPTEPRARARMEQWLCVEARYLRRPSETLVAQLVVAPLFGQRVDSLRVLHARAGLGQTLDVLDRALEGCSYLAGDHFTLADLAYMPSMQALEEARQLELGQRPALARWWQRIRQRASWQRVLHMRSPELTPEARSLCSSGATGGRASAGESGLRH